MAREKQLVKNTIIVALGKICTQFISFFLLPLYTSMLSIEEYGTIDLLNTYISLLIPLIFLQIDQAIFRYLIDARENENEKKRLISTTLIIVCVQAILYLILYISIGRFINNKYKYFLATNVVASMLSNMLLQISRGLGDNKTYSLGSLIAGVGTVVLNIIFIAVFKWGAYGMLISTLVANLVCASYIFFRKKIYKYISIYNYKKVIIMNLWKYSVPLVPNQISWWIITVSDRTIITNVLGIGVSGIYSASTKFSSICTSVFGIFNLTWSESASIHIKDKDNSQFFSDVFNSTMKLFISLCLGIIACMPFLFNILIKGNSYASAYYQIPILILSTIFSISVSLLGSVYVALKKSNEIAKTSIIAAIINITINLILIKKIGLYAASMSTLISYLSMAIIRYYDIQKYVKIKIDKKMVLVSIATLSVILIFYYIRNSILCICGALISILFTFFLNKNMLITILEFISNFSHKFPQ